MDKIGFQIKVRVIDIEVQYVDNDYTCIIFSVLPVMQRAWRERNPASRIKAAKDALEKNPE